MEPIPGSKADQKVKRYLPDVGRLLPQSAEAEKGVLSGFFLAPREVGMMCAEKRITKAHFMQPEHANIYAVLMERWEKSEPVDFVTVTGALRDKGVLDSCGGAAAITDLFTYLATAANVGYYLEDLAEKWTLREVIHVGTRWAAAAYDPTDDAQEVLAGFERDVFAVTQSRGADKKAGIRELIMKSIVEIQQSYENRGAVMGLQTGFSALDKMTDGLHAAEMWVIAARPSMGKTAFAMNIAEHVAVNMGLPVAVFSLEMSAEQLAQRVLCSVARVNMANIRAGFLSERDFPALTAAAERIAKAPLHIDDSSGLSILELKAKARRMASEHGIKALFVDYLQLLRSSSRKAADNRQVEVAEISTGLKGLSKELSIPVVVLAQLNRNPESRGGESKGRPRLSDLRESGSIEQDADVVGLLVREEYYAENDAEREATAGNATLIIGKQRNGPVGDVPLVFRKEFTRFENAAETGS